MFKLEENKNVNTELIEESLCIKFKYYQKQLLK